MELFPETQMCDLYQNPETRPRKGVGHWPALTTGCSRVWLPSLKRFAHGLELMLLHSIPVTRETSEIQRCPLVDVRQCTQRSLCFLAGNSMHGACVGLMFYAVLGCVRY